MLLGLCRSMADNEAGGDEVTGRATSGQPAATAEATLLEALAPDERLILPCLQHIQRALGYVSDNAVNVVAEFVGM